MSEKIRSVPGEDAVGGHAGGVVKGEPGRMNKKAKPTSPEIIFYKSLEGRKIGDAERFLPKFYGILPGGSELEVLVDMEDLTHGFDLPAILDIKIGKKTYGPDAKADKIEKMSANDKATTTFEEGSRLTGYKCYGVDYTALKVGKDVTFKVATRPDYMEHIKRFFSVGDTLRKDVIKHVLPDMKAILQWFQTTSFFSLYSASLLFVYDAKNVETTGRVRIIDFAHVFDLEPGQHDDNFIFGLEKLIGFFEEISQ